MAGTMARGPARLIVALCLSAAQPAIESGIVARPRWRPVAAGPAILRLQHRTLRLRILMCTVPAESQLSQTGMRYQVWMFDSIVSTCTAGG